MSDQPRRLRPESAAERARLDAAVRRATPLGRLLMPSRRNLVRSMGVYANVFALLVALGIPNGTLRQAAGGAMVSFDGAVRQVSSGIRVMVVAPVENGESAVWTESVADVSSPVENPQVSFMPEAPAVGVPELPPRPLPERTAEHSVAPASAPSPSTPAVTPVRQ